MFFFIFQILHSSKKIYILIFILLSHSLNVKAENLFIITTTSVYDTGFIDYINNEFQQKFLIDIKTISRGTGEALEISKLVNADILIVHDTPAENKFIQDGYGIIRHDLMNNYFIIVGPSNFDKKKHNVTSLNDLFLLIKEQKLNFISRGDLSGTHKKELLIWKTLNLKTENFKFWYKKVGQGMGAALNIANSLNAFTITDYATWLKFKNKSNLKIIYKDDILLNNQYGIILIKSKDIEHNNYDLAKIYINWILSRDGKEIVNNFKILGKQVFFHNH